MKASAQSGWALVLVVRRLSPVAGTLQDQKGVPDTPPRSWSSIIPLVSLALICSARPAALAGPPDSVVVQWNNAALQAVRDTHPGPPICARMLAVVSTCMYDAWAAYDPVAVGTRLGGSLRQPASERTAANKEQAISFAAYRALVGLFPQPRRSRPG